MTRFFKATALALLLALPATAPRAQTPLFDVARLDALFDSPPKVEVNLGGALLRIAAGGADDGADGAGDLLRGLRSIIVRVYALDTARDGLAGHLARIETDMAAAGWSTLVRVRPGDDSEDDVWVYVREAGDAFDGMAVLSLDRDAGDASFVFLDGPIDPAKIGSLGGRFGIPDVDEDDTEFSDEELEALEDTAERAAEQYEAGAEVQRMTDTAERAVEQYEAGAEQAEFERRQAEFERSEVEFRRSEAAFERRQAEFRRAEAARAAAARARAAKPARP